MITRFGCVVLTLLIGLAPALAGDTTEVGSLVLVPLKNPPKTIEVHVGDLLQLELDYPVVPDQMVADLKLEISAKGLGSVTTVHVPKLSPEGKPLIGAMGIAAFLRAEKPCDVTVKIVPMMSNGKDGAAAEFKVKVLKR